MKRRRFISSAVTAAVTVCLIMFMKMISIPLFAGNYPKELKAYRGIAPVLDGIISPWEYEDATLFTGTRDWFREFSANYDNLDLSVKAWVKHDGKNLYFAFDVTDDVIYGIDIPRWLPDDNPLVHDFTVGNSWPWFGDGIELFLNPENTWDNSKDENTKGNGLSWTMVCSTHKSYANGLKAGGIIEGEPRNDYSWTNYREWMKKGAMQVAFRVKSKGEGKGYIIEWKIASDPCLEISEGKYWSPDLGIVRMGLNIEIQDLDEKERGKGNFANMHHVDVWAQDPVIKGKSLLKNLGTLTIYPGKKPESSLAATYYISPRGQDSNNGLSPESPWQTIDKVNVQNLKPGDIVLFEAGQTFHGNLSIGANGRFGNPITLSSFGNGRAVINAGNGTAIYITGSHVVVRNLNCVGAGRLDGNTGNGIEARDAEGTIIDSIEVSGFQHAGVHVHGGSHARVTHVYAHENGYAGIHGHSSHYMYVGYCIAENNPGDPTVTDNHSGNGILLEFLDHGLIEYCEAFNNGWDMQCPTCGGGPCGIWTASGDSVVIQYCISHNNKTQPGKSDGGGFDIDGGASNNIIQYCYSYDNAGTGYLLCEYGTDNPFVNNTVRYCVSENDGRNAHWAGIHIWDNRGYDFGDCEIYNNVIYNSEGRHGVEMNGFGTNFNFRNNIIIIEGGGQHVRGLRGDLDQGRFQGNCYWTSGGGFSVGSYRSLQEWATATGQEKVNGKLVGLNIDPMLIAPGNGEKLKDPKMLPGLLAYRLQEGSPLIDAGLDLQGLFGIDPGPNDLLGNAIPFETQFDIGACEYQQQILIKTNIEYSRANDHNQKIQSLQLDAYQLPKQDHTKRPVIILVHGGGFERGDKGYTVGQGNFYPDLAVAFARKGYVAFSINYRLWPDFSADSFHIELDNAISDVLAAVKWIKNNCAAYGIDTTKMLIGGDSAGGGLSVNASYCNAKLFAGCIDMWGGLPPYGIQNSKIQQVNICPVGSHTPPTCIIHGTEDDVVPYYTSQCLSESLNAAGVYNELHPLQGAKHYPVILFDQIIQIMIDFSNKVVTGEISHQSKF